MIRTQTKHPWLEFRENSKHREDTAGMAEHLPSQSEPRIKRMNASTLGWDHDNLRRGQHMKQAFHGLRHTWL